MFEKQKKLLSVDTCVVNELPCISRLIDLNGEISLFHLCLAKVFCISFTHSVQKKERAIEKVRLNKKCL